MRKSWKWKLIGILSAVMGLCFLTGCKFRETFDDIINKHDLVASITYNINQEGISIGDKYEDKKTLYYKENSPALDLGASNVEISAPEVKLNYNANKYKLLGWYEADLDENGQVQTDVDGNVLLKDTRFDLASLRLQKGDSFVIYAKWQRLEVVLVQLVCDDNAVLKADVDGVEKEYRNGDIIKDYAFKNGFCGYPQAFFADKNKAYTFTEFYASTDVSDPANMLRKDGASWPIAKTEGQDTVIYAHYVEGNYTVIKDAAGVSKFFTNAGKAGTNFYLLYDIDCSSLTTAIAPVTSYAAKFYGNGHTISNVNVVKKDVKNEEISLFGDVKAGAILEDVTFENITVSFEINGLKDYVSVYWLFTSCADLATFDGVTFTNASLQITRLNVSRTVINNLYVEEQWVKNHYLYGGKSLDSDYTVNGVTYTSMPTVKVEDNEI